MGGFCGLALANPRTDYFFVAATVPLSAITTFSVLALLVVGCTNIFNFAVLFHFSWHLCYILL